MLQVQAASLAVRLTGWWLVIASQNSLTSDEMITDSGRSTLSALGPQLIFNAPLSQFRQSLTHAIILSTPDHLRNDSRVPRLDTTGMITSGTKLVPQLVEHLLLRV